MENAKLISTIALLLLIAGLPACGFTADDPKLEEAANWQREFRRENPELARQFAKECGQEINPGGNRDDAMKVMNCIRAKSESQG